MKYIDLEIGCCNLFVTPCVGVWIEIDYAAQNVYLNDVTPCVGVWIEIPPLKLKEGLSMVTPCVGVWIEITLCHRCAPS